MARDAFISNLCDFTLMTPDDSAAAAAATVSGNDGSTRGGTASGLGTAALVPASPGSAGPGGSGQVPLKTLMLESREGATLTTKNLNAMRTLFALVHRLSDLLGTSWIYVVDVLNCLDRILTSPKTTVEVRAAGTYCCAYGQLLYGLSAPVRMSMPVILAHK